MVSMSVHHGSEHISGKKKEIKPKLFGPDIFRWGGDLPLEGVGVKKFGMPLEKPRKTKLLGGYLAGYPGRARKFEKIRVQCLAPEIDRKEGQQRRRVGAGVCERKSDPNWQER